jgi:hypothetical protein
MPSYSCHEKCNPEVKVEILIFLLNFLTFIRIVMIWYWRIHVQNGGCIGAEHKYCSQSNSWGNQIGFWQQTCGRLKKLLFSGFSPLRGPWPFRYVHVGPYVHVTMPYDWLLVFQARAGTITNFFLCGLWLYSHYRPTSFLNLLPVPWNALVGKCFSSHFTM